MRTNSIRKALKFTNIVIILASIVPFIINTLYYNIALNQYEGIIENVYSANSLSSRLKGDIYTTMWNIVTGKTEFRDNTQYELIGRIRNNLDQLEKNANSADNGYLVQVARNTLDTMEGYVDRIGDNIAHDRPVNENEKILGEITSLSDILYDVIQKFVAAEMDLAHIQNTKIQRSMDLMTLTQVLLFVAILLFLLRNYRQLNRSINEPIYRLKTMASRIAQGDLSIRVERPEISELDELTDSLNTMAEKLIELIDQNVQKQRNLQKAEMKALQAQIAPHFMYNTLETILSLAEDGQTENVVTTTIALSSFFRLSLNKGKDWVTVAEEKSHVENYLAIQKMRYGAILEYDIDFSPEILQESMLKLLLQPLVENAIYHGIKMTRRRGHIALKGYREGERMVFTVEDNGLGMSADKLAKLKGSLSHYDVSIPGTGFGLYNVYKRIELYYEIDDGLAVESEYDKGCKITLRLPIVRTPAQEQTALSEGA
ncbi:MAG TPA: sensor histidine kinase [Treponemataceae bacterium]|nr:sensor histidine kinase [Treponemataceae bacterium]